MMESNSQNNLLNGIAIVFLSIAVLPVSVFSQEILVTNVSELSTAVLNAKPGHIITLADGEYKDFYLTIRASGTESSPLTIIAQNPGNVTFSGEIGMNITGNYIVLSSIKFQNGTVNASSKKMITLAGSYNRVTECLIDNMRGSGGRWIYCSKSHHNRIDHCWFVNKVDNGNIIETEIIPGSAVAMSHQVDYNYFSRPPRKDNGNSSIRFGGGTDYPKNPEFLGGCTAEYNLFENASGESEIITLKSGYNKIRYNTFLNCEGTMSIRHHNYNTVNDNYFLFTDGRTNQRHGGVSVRAYNQKVENNYFEGLLANDYKVHSGAINIFAGVSDNFLNSSHTPARKCDINNNTIVNCVGFALGLGTDYMRESKTILPTEINIKNNILISNGSVLVSSAGNIGTWENNTAWGGSVGLAPVPAGIAVTDPQLKRDDYGILRPGGPSAAPLSRGDVGPSWMNHTPSQAYFPFPARSELVKSQNLTIVWYSGKDAKSYDIYFGETSPGQFIGNQTSNNYNAKTLKPSTTYYWRIDTRNDEGVTTGIVWSFKTDAVLEIEKKN